MTMAMCAEQVEWPDGVTDLRKGEDFHMGYLRDEVPPLGLDAFVPGSPGYDALPTGEAA